MAKTVHSKVLAHDHKMGNKNRIGRTLGLFLAVLLILSCGNFPTTAQSSPTATTVPTPSATQPPTVAPTLTEAPPSLLTSVEMPCFSGPGDAYELVARLQAGEETEIVGKSNGYWVVKTAAGSVCWVSEQGAIPAGDVAAIPDVEPPPVPTAAPPASPANLEVLIVACYRDKSVKPSVFVNEFHVYWQDLSENEDGFRVYRDGNLVAELPADKTEVFDHIVAKNNRTYYYYVTAYNAVGESKSEGIGIGCLEGGGGGGGGYP